MVKRRRIALNYRVNYDFSAGIVIYIQNLIKGFKLLEDSLQPHLTIIYTEDSPIQEVKEIDYPYIDYFKYKPIRKNFFTKAINKISRETIGTNILRRYSFPSHADILYPYFDCDENFFLKRRYYWKPDFQEMYYPQYVSQVEYSYVVENMKRIASNQEYTLILSSQDSFNDFEKFFGPFRNRVKILRFISLLPDISQLNPKQVLMKYGIDKKFFVVSNQFWPHKNHRLVLEAINKIKEKHTDFVVVFTGKQSTYRDREYFSKLQVYINNENMKDHVRFIGFIPREDQLVIMKQSVAVIQPSLFEGWSTVIEDCKALNQYVLVGDLAVNQEQVNKNVRFFNRHSADDLAEQMDNLLTHPVKTESAPYDESIERFKQNLIDVFELEHVHS
ncbi:MAG: glycosyltransferase [Bacteroidia bacterium]|uniref:glycosyltransferase n=1 Tax=Candidatus Pollutiaquabacter sp. TaxID=3416354 RepID=UPI001A3B2763|nr:glycosyltransferase [Bacteroidota bacterium]MBL7948386.1 glycosyltransferase [Bacteroidia bacterium]MBP6010115.1 glycosyltransferase [Bacteroidia bacterium]MBP7269292.1 glycosyltransferase [Bacteroidia bacterium]MBP7437526.1 glycosyltransferase [Bacteroidia bacterium]